ncbi:hypothetical protein BX661DRAFT_188047 [Kickxella alabastrina]|uniref:uncharacterized protein n=1 Tax=Kickxella alabastrina TaxID=61397 RepID=UPI0022210FD9|nr:uncharacterized protein BX661DRAFT_188047 [Kickxella alabastrina]KAI7821831.1 hypothetical protein BX661DRAFT_188047 [Kickxella alabastrina]
MAKNNAGRGLFTYLQLPTTGLPQFHGKSDNIADVFFKTLEAHWATYAHLKDHWPKRTKAYLITGDALKVLREYKGDTYEAFKTFILERFPVSVAKAHRRMKMCTSDYLANLPLDAAIVRARVDYDAMGTYWDWDVPVRGIAGRVSADVCLKYGFDQYKVVSGRDIIDTVDRIIKNVALGRPGKPMPAQIAQPAQPAQPVQPIQPERRAEPAGEVPDVVPGGLPHFTCWTNRVKTKVILSTGSSMSMIRMDKVTRLGLTPDPNERTKWASGGIQPTWTLGTAKLTTRIGGVTVDHTVHVSDALLAPMVAGTDTISQLFNNVNPAASAMVTRAGYSVPILVNPKNPNEPLYICAINSA